MKNLQRQKKINSVAKLQIPVFFLFLLFFFFFSAKNADSSPARRDWDSACKETPCHGAWRGMDASPCDPTPEAAKGPQGTPGDGGRAGTWDAPR